MKILCLILVITFLVINHKITASNYYHCYSTDNFSSDSEYGSSRNGQLTDLATQVKDQDGYYYGYTITTPPTPVPYCYGLCRKDLTSSTACFNCITNSTNELINNCLFQKQVIAWGNDGGCIVGCVPPDKRSNLYEISPSVHICNTTNVSEKYGHGFGSFLANLTTTLAVTAAQEGSLSFFPGYNEPQYYATEESDFTDFSHKVYAIGFCVPSLSPNGCNTCLQAASNESDKYCSGKQGATILTPSCVLRYELYPFFQSPVSGSPSPSPARKSVPSSSSTDVTKGKRERRALAVVIVLPLIALLTVIFLPIYFRKIWWKRQQREVNRDPIQQENLHWEIRHKIIQGVARGLLYLHEEAQLTIVHRDLKASNVLLDESMNPKISDFGTARLYAEDHDSASKIVGTYGYMAPEYAKYGRLSTKVDVFSFGVLLLEIISGTKNNDASSGNPSRSEHLLSKAWKCWTAGKPLLLVDEVLLSETSHIDKITRCIQIGLLCVQENAQSRPSMSLVILMLEGCSQSLLNPSKPAYLMNFANDEVRDIEQRSHSSGPLSSSSHSYPSVNGISFTNTYPEPR